MGVSASLTGITTLKNSIFKTRYGGLKDCVSKPMEGVILKKDDHLEIARLKRIKERLKKAKKVSQKGSVKRLKKDGYSVNKKLVIHKIRGFVNQMPGEKLLYFWTITFPLKTTDDTAFILFNKWLTRLRKEKMLKSYLWVSERQENGTIHFHIAINHRMDVKKSNRFMRACIFTCIDQKEIEFSRVEAKNYNGVDISKDRKTRRVTNFAKKKKEKSLTNYLTKYISKNSTTFNHLAWHCSRDYSNLVISVRFTAKEWEDLKLGMLIDYEKKMRSEWFEFCRWKQRPPKIIEDYLACVNVHIINLLNKN